MSYPAQSNFRTEQFGSAWWTAFEAAQNRWVLAESVGRAVIAQIQAVIYAGVRPGTRGFNTTLARRIRVDGIPGPETLNGLWAYGRAKGLSTALLAPVEADLRARRWSRTTQLLGIWLAYHQGRLVDLDVGPAGARQRVQRVDPPIAFEATSEQVRLPENVVLPAYLEAAAVPEASESLLRVVPQLIPLDANGNAMRDQARAATGGTRDPRLETPPTDTGTPGTGAGGGSSTDGGGTGGGSSWSQYDTASATQRSQTTRPGGVRGTTLVFGGMVAAGLLLLATDQ